MTAMVPTYLLAVFAIDVISRAICLLFSGLSASVIMDGHFGSFYFIRMEMGLLNLVVICINDIVNIGELKIACI